MRIDEWQISRPANSNTVIEYWNQAARVLDGYTTSNHYTINIFMFRLEIKQLSL